jgi:hypothetical protein
MLEVKIFQFKLWKVKIIVENNVLIDTELTFFFCDNCFRDIVNQS